MRKYLLSAMVVACCASFNFGVGTVNFTTSKEFVVINLRWCEGTYPLYDCSKSRVFGGFANGGVFIGAAIGAYLIGFFAKYGRRKSLLALHGFAVVGGLFAAFAQCFTMLLIGRIGVGVATGLSGMVPMFISEVAPFKKRGLYGSMYPVFLTFGQFVGGLFQLLHGRVVDDTVVRCTSLDKFVWRTAQGMPALVGLVAIVSLLFVFTHDTPQELIQAGKKQQAREVIEKLHGPDAVDEVYAEIDRDLEVAKTVPNMSFLEAFKNKSHRHVILVILVLSALQQLTGIGVFISNAARLFITVMGRSFTSTVVASMSVVISFLSTLSLVFFIDKFGRRPLMICGVFICTVSILIPCIIKPIGGNEKWSNILSAISTLGFIPGFSVGMGSVLWIHIGEAFPSEFKNSATSFCVLVNWVCASIIVIASESLLSYSEVLTYAIFLGFLVINLVFVILYFKESRNVPIGKAYYQ